MKGYFIIPDPRNNGLFTITNNDNGKIYNVDINTPYCRPCKSWKYNKKKYGKKICKHIRLCKGIKNEI